VLEVLGITPIPTLPLAVIRIASTPPSLKAMVSAAGKNMPVFVSPLVVNAGNAAVPACKVVTPVALSVVNAPVDGVVSPIVPLRIAPVKVNAVPLVVAPVMPPNAPALLY